ncbi:MAG: apolipoprotein N-acyltransferase [Streptosporangiales bacterium]|nr:apolipoprotein N-acyltransferase [Streptosporangiales bacterium]
MPAANQPHHETSRRRAAGARLFRAAAAAGGGLLILAAFPPIGWWPLASVGVALTVLAIRGASVRFGALLGLLAGLALFVPLLRWIQVIGTDGWIVLAVMQSLYVAALGGATAVVSRLQAWPLWSAALWVAEEFVRSRFPLGGFTWGRLAFSQTDSPFTPYAAVGGAPLVTFVTALAGCALAWALVTARRRRTLAVTGLASAVVMPVAPVVAYPELDATSGRPVRVAAVQGNVPQLGLDFLGQREAVLNNHTGQTHRLAELVRAGRIRPPDMVVWPENSSDIDPGRDLGARQKIQDAVADVGVPVLVGTLAEYPERGERENRGVVWDPETGAGEHYVKRHPVPFGEYVPFRSVLAALIGRFDMVPLDMVKGDRPGVMRLGPARIGDVICFEVAYDGLVRDVVGGGAQILVVQTNNATFGLSGQPEQQLAISRLRAVEHGRTVVVAATSGISAIVAPDGRTLDVSEEFTPDLLVERVPARDTVTLADRLGETPEWALTILALGAVLAGTRGAFIRKRT